MPIGGGKPKQRKSVRMDVEYSGEMEREYSAEMWSLENKDNNRLLRALVSRISELEVHQEHTATRKWVWKAVFPVLLLGILLSALLIGSMIVWAISEFK